MRLEKGFFCVIDGTDGAGKKTQTDLLVQRLRKIGFEIEVADFPQYGQKSAGLVEDYLNGKYGSALEVGPYRASVFYAVDRYAKSPEIKKWISEGKIIISNRYVSANMGHQAGKIKNLAEREKFLEWLDYFEFELFEIPRSDVNIFLYTPPEVGQILVERKETREYIHGKKKDIHEADLQHLIDAAEAYKYVAKKYNWITIECAPDGTINSMRTQEDIHEEIFEKIRGFIKI